MARFHLGSANVLDYLKHFKAVTLAVSIDNLGARNNYIRYGSEFRRRDREHRPGAHVSRHQRRGQLRHRDAQRGRRARDRGVLSRAGPRGEIQHVRDQLADLPPGAPPAGCAEGAIPAEAGGIAPPRTVRQCDPHDPAAARRGPVSDFSAISSDDLDRHRGTSWLDLWPEFKPHARRSGSGAEPPLPRAISQTA